MDEGGGQGVGAALAHGAQRLEDVQNRLLGLFNKAAAVPSAPQGQQGGTASNGAELAAAEADHPRSILVNCIADVAWVAGLMRGAAEAWDDGGS